MARFRGARHLTCFYCGKRSGLRYDGVTRHFLCLYCDATNYLDENGEITDPPVATECEAAATQYAASKPSAPTRSIFCATCLKNQHLFTKSLAQYFPDDPSDPEYAQLDRNYYRYLRGLEKRYPQVCDACAVEVEARIRQAGYTAKTDHLRRMMDLSRGRNPTAAKTALHRVHELGRAMWRAGFVLQLFWHLTTVALVLQQSGDGLRDADRSTAAAIAGDWTRRATAVVPAQDTLMRWSIGAAVASAWWNPHFVQLNRGFTCHLPGFTQWYCFQGLIILCRLVFCGVFAMDSGRFQSRHAQLSAQVAMAAVMTLMYVLSGRSIRVDTSPLFGTNSQPVVVREAASSEMRKTEATKTLSELFNDALESADSTPSWATQQERNEHSLSPFGATASRHHISDQVRPFSISFLQASDNDNSRPRQVQDGDEMDWSPISPPHRAFVDAQSPRRGAGMGEQIWTEDMSSNPFRYKVPAAPLAPARRLRNPLRAPKTQKPAAKPVTDVFSGGDREGEHDVRCSEMSGGVEFRQPQFFAPERDDASSLTDLLSQSFSLSQEDEVGSESNDCAEGALRRKTRASDQSNADRGRRRSGGLAEPLVLAALLATWLLATTTAIPRRAECQLVVMAVTGALALGRAADVGRDARHDAAAALALAAWAVTELATVCWVSTALWKGETTVMGWYGAGVLATMLARQAWRTVA